MTGFADFSPISAREYHHLCFSCDGSGVLRMFVDGAIRGSIAGQWAGSSFTGYSQTLIVAPGDGNGALFVDNVRLRYGFAYTSNFTPDTSI